MAIAESVSVSLLIGVLMIVSAGYGDPLHVVYRGVFAGQCKLVLYVSCVLQVLHCASPAYGPGVEANCVCVGAPFFVLCPMPLLGNHSVLRASPAFLRVLVVRVLAAILIHRGAVMVILYLSAELVVTDTTASGGIISIIVYLCVVALVLR
jgi:hypothetical protein